MPRSKVRASDRTKGKSKESKVSKADQKKGKKVTKSELRFIEKTDIRTQNFRDREEKRSRERAASAKTDSGLAGGKRKAKDEKNPRGERGRSAGKGRLSSDDGESVDSIRYSTDNQPSTSQELQLEISTNNATSPSRGRQRDNLQRTERREVSIAKPKTEASTEINKRTPVSPNIKVVEKTPSNIKTKGEAPPNIKTKGEAPPNIKTKGEAPSNIKTKGEAPSNIKTKGEAPSNIKTKGEAPSDAKAKREAPSNTRTKVDAPSGSKTKEENTPSTRTKPEALSNKKTKGDILLGTKIGEDGSPGPISGTKSPSNSKRTTGASTSDKKGYSSPLNKTGKDVLGNNKTRKVTYSIAEIEIEDSPNTKRVGGTLSHTSSDGEAPFITKTKNKSPTKTKANVDFPPNTKSIRDAPSNIKTRKGEHSNNRTDVHFNNETSEETTFNSSTWEGETPSDTKTRKEAFSKSKIKGENVTNKTKREGCPSNKVRTEVHFNTEETPFSNRTWLETPSCIKTKRDDQSSRKRKDGHSSNKTGTEVHFDSDISEETPIKSTTGKAPSNTKTKGEDPSNNQAKKYITSSKRTGSKAKPNTEEQEQVSSSSCIGEVPCKKNTEREAPSNNRRRKDTLTSTKTGEETTSKANTKGVTTDTKVLGDTLSATKIAQFANKMVTDVSFISRTGEEIPFSSNHNRKSTSAKTQQTESRDGRNKVEPSGKHQRRNGDMKNIEEQDIKSRSLSSSSVKKEKSRGDERGDTRVRSATQNKTKRHQKTDTKRHGQKGVWGMKKKKVSSPENSSAEETSELKVNIPVPATHDSESDGERVVGALDDSDDERSSLASSEEEKARETLSIKSRSSREQQREGESGDEESTSSTSSSESSEEKSAMNEKNIGKSEEEEEEDDEDDSEEQREVDPEQKENMEDVEDNSDEEVIAKVEGEQKQVANEMVETEDEKDSDEDEDDTDDRSVKTQEDSSEETESDGKSKEGSDSEDESEAEKTSEQMKHNSRAGGVLLPFRKPLPSGVKAKLLNIRLGTASGDLVNNTRFGKGLGNLTPSSQPSSESETTCEKSSNSVKDKGQRTSHSRRRREAKVDIPVKQMHIFTAQSHIITNLRRRQKAARKTLLNRREEDQHLTTKNVLGNPEKEAAVLSEEDINLELKVSSCSTVSSHSLENELSTKVAMGKEVQNEGKDTQTKQEDHQNEDKEMVQGKEEEKMATMSGQKDGKTACSISAFRRVTGWLRRVPPKKSNLKERLASVARAIGITDWLFRTFRKKKKQRKCELKRKTAMRILSTSRMVNQHNQAALGGSSIGKNHKDQDKENEELGCADKGCEDKCGQQNADSPTESMRQVSEHSEIEESAVTGDAKYAIVFPRIHHLAKTIKISPAVQRSIRSTGQRVIVSVQPASSNRIPERDVKDSPNIHQKQPESPVPAVSPRYRPIQMIKYRQKENQTAQSSEGGLRSTCLTKLGPLREEQGDIHSLEAQSVPQEGTQLHDSNSASPDEEEEEAEQGPFYQATTHVHWAQSMPGRGDPTSWLSSETLLPRLTIENLSKWTIYQDIPHSKQRQTIQHPRDRWEAEDSTEDLLQMAMSKKQAWAGVDSPEVEEVSDLSFLEDVCESAILLCLKKRFHRNAIYFRATWTEWRRTFGQQTFTSIGHMLLSVNPFKTLNIYTPEMAQIYQDGKTVEKSPHIFSVVEEAFTLSQSSKCTPNIILSGHSGSGKSESVKLVSQYLTGQSRRQGSRVSQLSDFLTILESFGNSSTVVNSNSTRFGKVLQIFLHRDAVVGSSISQYLLEKSRVVFQALGERSFHVFYELLEGLPEHEKQGLYLQEPETYYYLNQGRACDLPGKDDGVDFLQLGKSLHEIGLSEEQLASIWAILSAILQLGNICFTSSERDSVVSASAFSVTEIRIIAGLLQISPEGLQKAITERVTVTSYDRALSPLSVEAAIDARDAISKTLYSLLFDWLLEKGNDWLCPRETDNAVGVFDICGFENLGVNSLEQLCRNFANEQIQDHSTRRLVTQEQAEYAREGLCWVKLTPEGTDTCLELLTDHPHGIFHILEEQSGLAQATDHTFLQKCHYHHGDKRCYIKPKLPLPVFTLQHYAGAVTYQVHNFLNKNRDVLPSAARDVLTQSKLRLLSDLFKRSRETSKQRNATCRAKSTVSTLAGHFQLSLQELTTRLARGRTFFVRCILPNSKYLPGIFDIEFVSSQLRNSGILEAVHLMKEGYPVRIPLQEFVSRYGYLAGRCVSFSDERETCTAVLTKVLGDPSALYQIGLTKVFLKERGRQMLRSRWEEMQRLAALTLQKNLRGFLNRKNFQAYRRKITVIQAHVRGHQARRRYRRLKYNRVQFGAIVQISRLPTIHQRICQGRAVQQLRDPGQEPPASMDLSQLNIPAELAAVLNSAEVRSHAQNAPITEVPPPQIKVQSVLTLPPDINNYPLSGFIQSYFKDPTLPPLGQLLRDPLTRVSRNDHGPALEMYKLALRFVTDTAMPNWQQRIVGNYLAGQCLRQPSLRDEILCQVVSLTIQNDNDGQCQRAWLLLSVLLSCLIPSPTLEKPLLKYVSDQCPEGFKAICQHKLLRAGHQGSPGSLRTHAPTLLEWTAIERKGKMVVDMFTANERLSTELDSWTTGEQIAGWLLQFRGVEEAPRGWSVSILDRDNWLDLAGHDFLLDVLAEVEDGVPPPFSVSSDFPFGDESNIPEPPPDFAPTFLPGQPSFSAPGFPNMPPPGFPPAPPPPGPPPGLPPGFPPAPPPPPVPPPMPPSMNRGSLPIPPAPMNRAPALPNQGLKHANSMSSNQRMDNYLDGLFRDVLSSPGDLDRPENLNRRMKGGGGIGPTRQTPFSPSGMGMMPSYSMPMMNGMMPAMGNMPMMPAVPGMMPQGMMPQMMPQPMAMPQPVMPAVDATQLAAQQQAFINQQALLLAQQMTLQATMLSQQQQPPQRQDPPRRNRETSPPPAPKPTSKPTPLPKQAPAPSPSTPPAPPPSNAPVPAPPPPAPAPKLEIRNHETELYPEVFNEDDPEYSQQKRTFQQKRQYFQKMQSQDIKVKSVRPPSKILLPSTGYESEEETPEPVEPEPESEPEPEPEPQPDIPTPKPPPMMPTPAPKRPDAKATESKKGAVMKPAPKPQPSREIREIIKMYQNRPLSDPKPFEPVRRPAKSFLKKKDPKEEALERLRMGGNVPSDTPDSPSEKNIEMTNSIREKQKPLLGLFLPGMIPPPPDQQAPGLESPSPTFQSPGGAGRYLDGDKSIRSSLSKLEASVFFSYSDVTWRLQVRKEIFYPKEKFSHQYYLNLLCEQIIRDTFSESGIRLTRDERRKMRDLLNEFRVGSDVNAITEDSVKKRIVVAARDNWENYFSRLFPVSLDEGANMLLLGVSHRGIRLLKEVSATGIQQRHLKTLCSYSFADVLSLEMTTSHTLRFSLRSEELLLHSEKARPLKALVDIFIQELLKDSNHVIAMRSYITDDKSLLHFKQGDIIKLIPMEGLQPGWQFGSIGGRSGLFLSSYVKPAAAPDYYSVLERREQSKTSSKLLRRTVSKESSQVSDVSGPTHSPQPPVNDTANYTMVEFALKYFREAQTMMGWKGMAAEGKKSVELVQYTKIPIQESLIYYTDKEVKVYATRNFMTLMRFMGDQQSREQDDEACVFEILQLCREKEILRDEVYCQIIKQITQNPNPESCTQGWRLLSLLTGFYLPTPTLLPHVTKYLQDINGAHQEISRICQENLRHTLLYNGRRHLPTNMELEALLTGRVTRRLVVMLPGRIEFSTKIKTFTVAADVIPEVCEHLGVSEPIEVEEFALFANKGQGEIVRPMRAGEYIHDFLLQDKSVALEFRRVMWKAPVTGHNELYVQVHFNQMLPDYMKGNALLISPQDILEMQVGTVAAILHRTKGFGHPPNKQELQEYIPSSVVNRLNLQAVQQHLLQELRATQNVNPMQAKILFLETVSSLPMFEYNVFVVKRISEPGVTTPCFVALNHQHLLILENNSKTPHCSIPLQDIQTMRTMRPLDSNTLPGMEVHYGTAASPRTLWVELPEAKELYHTLALVMESMERATQKEP